MFLYTDNLQIVITCLSCISFLKMRTLLFLFLNLIPIFAGNKLVNEPEAYKKTTVSDKTLGIYLIFNAAICS